MTESLETILSGREPVAETSNETVEESVAQTPEAQANEGQQEQTEGQAEGEESGQKMVPHEALHAERQKVKRYTEQVADFQKQLSETNAAWERRMAELVEAIKPKQEQQQPDWWTDPDAILNQRLGQTFTPIANDLSNVRAELFELKAIQRYGEEKVGAFKAYIQEATARGDPEIQTLGAQMRAAADPMAIGMDWFEKRTFDPAAKEAEIEARVEARILEKYGISPQQNGAAPMKAANPVMPSNMVGTRNVGTRTGSMWSGPTPITDIFKR